MNFGTSNLMIYQGRRRRSGHGRTTFLAENSFGWTTIFDYSAENVFAFSTFFFLKCSGPINCSVNLSEGVKDSHYKNNHENDTCIKDWYCHII